MADPIHKLLFQVKGDEDRDLSLKVSQTTVAGKG